MSLNGSATRNFARHSLIIEWTASQSIANNNSSVTAKVFLRSNDAYGAMYAGATNAGSVTVNGTTKNFSANSNLSAYQKKQLTSQSFTVGHNADGSKTFSFSTTYNVNVTFHSVYYGNQTASGSGTLNKIPRASSLNPLPTTTVPNSVAVTVVRQSSSFTHSLTIWVAKNSNPTLDNDAHWEHLMEKTNVGTSTSFQLTPAQFSKVLTYMGSATSWKYKVKLWNSGVSGLNAQRHGYFIPPTSAKTAPSSARTKLKVGEKISGTLSSFNSNSSFSYDLTLQFGGYNKVIATNLKSNSWSYTLVQADIDGMLARIPNAKTGWGQVATYSKYNGTKYRGLVTGNRIDFDSDEASVNPTISGSVTWADTNTTTTGLSGSATSVIQGKSTVDVVIPASFASARSSATLKTISASLGGVSASANYNNAGQTLTLAKPNLSTNGNLVVSVTDSRGYTTAISNAVTGYPYTDPDVTFTAHRLNQFQTETIVALNSSWSPVTVSGANKNTISKVQYRVKKSTDSAWGALTNLPYTVSGNKVTSSATTIELDNSYTWNMELSLTDKLGTYTSSMNIPAGKPIMFMDANTRAVAIGALPTGKGKLEIGAGEDSYHRPETTPAIYLNNSDIAGLNGIWFGPDRADNLGEGLHFITTAGANAGDIGNDDKNTVEYYDTIYWRDKAMYWDNKLMAYKGNNGFSFPVVWLWTGTWFLTANHTINLSVPISKTRNGIVLMWCKMVNSTAYFEDVHETYISKSVISTKGGALVNDSFWAAGAMVNKFFYVYDDKIVGHASNGGDNQKAVLVRIHEW